MLINPRKGFKKQALEFLFQFESKIARTWSSFAFERLFKAQWSIEPTPQWFDHNIDCFYQWSKFNNSAWLERGFFNSLALNGGDVLELSCGDGFYTKHFYAIKSKNIIACDLDISAIKSASKNHKLSNIEYVVANIINEMPLGKFDNVIWDFGFNWNDFFTDDELHIILTEIKKRLNNNGIFSGHLIKNLSSTKHLDTPLIENMQNLKSFLLKYFANSRIVETHFPNRHNFYFWASDHIVPFDKNWKNSI